MNKKEKYVAALAPASYLIAGYVFMPLAFLIPISVYIYSRKSDLEFSRMHSLRLIDFVISVFIYSLIFGALYAAIEVVEKDSGNSESLLVLGNEAMLGVFMVVVVMYLLIPTAIAIYKSLKGCEYRYPLSLSPFEKLGGRNGSNKTN